jgi:hypothetical protein
LKKTTTLAMAGVSPLNGGGSVARTEQGCFMDFDSRSVELHCLAGRTNRSYFLKMATWKP